MTQMCSVIEKNKNLQQSLYLFVSEVMKAFFLRLEKLNKDTANTIAFQQFKEVLASAVDKRNKGCK